MAAFVNKQHFYDRIAKPSVSSTAAKNARIQNAQVYWNSSPICQRGCVKTQVKSLIDKRYQCKLINVQNKAYT